VEGLVKV